MREVKTEETWTRLQCEPLDVGGAVGFLYTTGAGGIDIFIGTTRQWTGEAETVELAYDAYEAMALKEMQQLIEQARRRWPILRAVMVHRLGIVPVAEASVVIGVATPHRAEAFAACRFLIDTLKQQIPIWKQERYADGRTAWVEGVQPATLPGERTSGLSP